LEIARHIFGEDFARLNASRSFEVWWKDTLVNSFVATNYLWSYPEILPIIEAAGCEFYSSSPRWADGNKYEWYKSASSMAQRSEKLRQDWAQHFAYFLTGLAGIVPGMDSPASAKVTDATAAWVNHLSDYAQTGRFADLVYPQALDTYLSGLRDPLYRRFGDDLEAFFAALHGTDAEHLRNTYQQSNLRNLWGTAYHYLCFTRDVSVF
jgi:hypothetical protein